MLLNETNLQIVDSISSARNTTKGRDYLVGNIQRIDILVQSNKCLLSSVGSAIDDKSVPV